MTKLVSSPALLTLSIAIGLAWGQDLRSPGDSLYGGHSLLQPGVTRTVTMTPVSTVTVGQNSCSAVYVPTTITVYTGCSSASGVSSVSGFPVSSQSNQGPWLNTTATGPPCTHVLPTSSALTAPGNMSTPIGWNQTTFSRPTSTGTAGTTIQTADPIDTSSFTWRNSTQTSAEQDSTSTLTLTLTSSTVVTVNMTLTSGHGGPTAPSFAYGTGPGLPTHSSTLVSSSYQPSLTYQTTAPAPSNPATHPTSRNGTIINTSSTVSTSTSTLPPSWGISTVSIRTKTSSSSMSGNSSALMPTFSSSFSPTTLSPIDITTATNDPIFTTTSNLTSSTRVWSNKTSTSATKGSNTATTTLYSTSSTLLASPSSTAGNGNGDQYGSYTYGAPSLSPTASYTSTESGISSVDPIGGTSARTSSISNVISTTATSSLRPSTFSTHTLGSGITGTTGTAEATTASQHGGGYGYYGEDKHRVARG